MNLRIIGKKGSHAVRMIIEGTGIQRYRGNTGGTVDAIVNYGLSGDALRSFLRLYPSANRVPILNEHAGRAKLSVIRLAEQNGVTVPKSRLTLPPGAGAKQWIEKRQNSIGGIGIRFASKGRTQIPGKYFQEYVENRKYELRVHAFNWMKDWKVQKRIGDPGEIAWNFNNGGAFMSINHPDSFRLFRKAMEISSKILKLLRMSFGAADFLVDTKDNLYFIEINSAPGFQELSKNIYINAFNALKTVKASQVRGLL